MRRLPIILLGLAAAALVVFFSLPAIVDGRMNSVATPPPYPVGAQAQALHRRLFVADLHDDVLLWPRPLLQRHARGHSDLPRLREGGVSLQVFSTVTKTPRGLNFDRNAGDSDNITLLALAQGWPPRTWGSLLERAVYQADKLREAAQASDGQLRVVTAQDELAAALQGGLPAAQGRVIAVLATEGLHVLEGRLEHIDRLQAAGFRIMGLTHFFDNEVGGSAHGLAKGGLTPLGRQVVQRLQERRLLVDLAHASPQVIDEVLAMARRPVLVSHTGVQATCRGPRNLSDAHIRAIAATGGVIGIGYFHGAVCGLQTPAIVAAIRHVTRLVGARHVALGSDFDGAVQTGFDTTGLAQITQGLLDAGFSEAEIADIMGGNVLRLLQAELPPTAGGA
jgi:microsomal dipeptidase-like Zn-dependent dipeptidase